MKNLIISLSSLISSIIVLVVGILCIVAGASSGETSANAYEGISLTLGISLIVASGLVLLLTLIAVIMSKGKTTFGPVAIGVSLTLALGIFFVSYKNLGSQLIWLFLNFVPFVLIVVGSIIIADAVINLIIGVTRKELPQALIPSIVSIVLGSVSVLFGALMVGDSPVISKEAQLIIFGIIIVIYALAICAIASFALYANRFANKEPKKDSIDAEVNEVKTEE